MVEGAAMEAEETARELAEANEEVAIMKREKEIVEIRRLRDGMNKVESTPVSSTYSTFTSAYTPCCNPLHPTL
jgi:hypothetical protein